MPALKYAEALGSGLGILFGIRSWGGIREEKYSCNAPQLLPRIKDRREGDLTTLNFSKRRRKNKKRARSTLDSP